MQNHPFEDADYKTCFCHDTELTPLTDEDQLFCVEGVWMFFDPSTLSDRCFPTKDQALNALKEIDNAK